jgi:hypothetical protein
MHSSVNLCHLLHIKLNTKDILSLLQRCQTINSMQVTDFLNKFQNMQPPALQAAPYVDRLWSETASVRV